MLYTGTLIGAGFASGSEIAVYFIKSGGNFIIPLFISCFIFVVFGILSVKTAVKIHTFDYWGFMNSTMGKKAADGICFFTGVFFFVLFTAMISAFGSLCQDMGIINGKIARLIFIAFCIPVLINGTSGLIKTNSILVPVLVFGVIVSSVFVLKDKGVNLYDFKTVFSADGCFKSIAFAFYNMVSCVPVLVECSGRFEKETKPVVNCFLTGIIIFIIGSLMGCALMQNYEAVDKELPMMFILKSLPVGIYYLYAVSFILSVYTTAASNGYCAIKWFMNNDFTVFKMIIFLFAAYFVSGVSFTVFVEKLYIVFSLIGAAEFMAIVFYRLKF